jgi:hypothetical protein
VCFNVTNWQTHDVCAFVREGGKAGGVHQDAETCVINAVGLKFNAPSYLIL